MDANEAIRRSGGVKALAKLLNVSVKAVYAWKGKMPPLRLYQLKELCPQWFKGPKQ